MLNRYIVMLNNDVPDSDVDKIIADIQSAGGKLAHRYRNALQGFSAAIPESHLRVLQDSCKAGDSKIAHIEPVIEMGIDS
ncbi:unnamed protein product [Rhizoctonia solani]|nr:unnamed protein product [Rhizoctonia solani]